MSDNLHDIRETIRDYFLKTGDNGDKRTWLELARDSSRDGLTGLYNRKYFMDNYPKVFETSKANGLKLALVMVDLDHFKNINDSFGHIAGDNTLVKFSEILREKFPEREGEQTFVARYGGEEIVIVTRYSDRESFEQRVNRLKDELSEETSNSSYHHDGRKKYIQYTASFGIAFMDSKDIGPESLLNKADKALYQAKAGGRNRVVVAQSD